MCLAWRECPCCDARVSRRWGCGGYRRRHTCVPPPIPMQFQKMSLRGAKRRGNPLPLCDAVREGARIATPACALVRNDTGFCQRRASGRGRTPAPTHNRAFFVNCHYKERSDVGIRYPHTARGAAGVGRVVRRPTPTDAWQNGATHGEYGLPHQCAHRFAMTGFRGVWCVSAGGAVRNDIAFSPRKTPKPKLRGLFTRFRSGSSRTGFHQENQPKPKKVFS